MELEWKEDWEPARQRLLAWWEREAIDRPVMQIFAPREQEDVKTLATMFGWAFGPGQKHDFDTGEKLSIEDRWLRADHLVRSRMPKYERIYWAGEAFPYFFINQGPVSIPAYLGSPWTFDRQTGWGDPVIENWDTFDYPKDIDPDNRYWKATAHILQPGRSRAARARTEARGFVRSNFRPQQRNGGSNDRKFQKLGRKKSRIILWIIN